MAKKPKKKDSSKESAASKKSEQERDSTGYPWWAKTIVGLVLVFGTALAVLFAIGVNTVVSMVRQAPQPEYIKETVGKIANIQEPLPDGFKYSFATSFPGFSLINIVYQPDGSTYFLVSLPPMPGESAREIADKMAVQELQTISPEHKIEKKGTLEVAGENLEYALGSATDRQGRKFGGFVGCLVLPKKQVVQIYGLTATKEEAESPNLALEKKSGSAGDPPASEPTSDPVFKIEPAIKLLSAIKDFGPLTGASK